ncbi:hypothetical protein ACJZ2D_012857 [Fusarium nematophilum]
MASPSGTTDRPHSSAGPKQTATHGAHPSPESPSSPGPSLIASNTRHDLQSSTPKIDDTLDNIALSPTITDHERKNTSQEVLRGFQSLGLDVPQRVAAKAATSYTDMAPMARFLSETCGIDPKVAEEDSTICVRCSSCQATAGSWKSG